MGDNRYFKFISINLFYEIHCAYGSDWARIDNNIIFYKIYYAGHNIYDSISLFIAHKLTTAT